MNPLDRFAVDLEYVDLDERRLQQVWVDAHTTSAGTPCPNTGPLLLELPGPICDLCGHQLTQEGQPLTEVYPLTSANPAHDLGTTTPFPQPLTCRYWAELVITERLVDVWGRSALHVGIGRPTGVRSVLHGGSWPLEQPVRVREAWLGPSYTAAAAAADQVATYGASWKSWGVAEPVYGQRHPASVRRWLLEQWRSHATDRERATEPATRREPGPAGLHAEPDEDRYWQDHDGWQAVPLADRAVMHCVHCTGALTYGYDGPGTGWVHQQTHHNSCPPQGTSGAAREVYPA